MEPASPTLREQGLQALREGSLDSAADLLARAVMADPADAEARALLGVAYSQKGLHAEAKRALESARELQPQNPSILVNLGVALERASNLQGAAIAYRDALKLQPDHPQAKAKLQAMGPQAAALLATAPKPLEPVGVPSYTTPPPAPGAAPGGPPGPGVTAFGAAMEEQGPAGTLVCPRCGEYSRPGLSCEFCGVPFRGAASPVARVAAPAPAAPPVAAAPAVPAAPQAVAPAGYSAPVLAYGVKPHRGVLVLLLGLGGFFFCPVIPVLSILAWVAGNRDLSEMQAGTMDPAGHGLTQAGRIIGIVTVVLNALWWLALAAFWRFSAGGPG